MPLPSCCKLILVKGLLQVDSPNYYLAQLLSLPFIDKKVEELNLYFEDAEDNPLLGTIQIPRNLNILGNRLPKANYRKRE